jgi:hypothetical protein
MRLGHHTSRRFKTTRGLPQGAPESPFVFTVLVDSILMNLNKKWQSAGTDYGFRLDGWYFPSVAYADDIVVLATSQEALEQMIRDLTNEFRKVGLEIGHSKTNWSSSVTPTRHCLNAGDAKVEWKSIFTYVGICMTLQGTTAPAMQHRMKQAQGTYRKWQQVIGCPWIHLNQRMKAVEKAVWPSLLWGAAAWHPTKVWQEKLSSWGARAIADAARIRKHEDMDAVTWWRERHRKGHAIMQQYGMDPNVERKVQLHRWAGHVARAETNSNTAMALRTRGLQWWRDAQKRYNSKWDGVHPKRFSCWRWESQLTTYGPYKDGCEGDVHQNSGWLALAQDRLAWKAGEKLFATA